MKVPARLGLYGLVLAIVFAVAAATANAVVPEATVQSWVQDSHSDKHQAGDDMQSGAHEAQASEGAASLGLGLQQDGYQLSAVSAPAEVGLDSELSLIIVGPDGAAVTDFALEHEKELHLIVVRNDGQHFRHVHPQRATDGTWSIPWTWTAAGSYRIYADFTPAQADQSITVSRSVQVSGSYDAVPSAPTRTAAVEGFEVTVEGDLVAGTSSTLTMSITQAGQPVTTLQPYLGAFGHLVALREGDLAYLHVHPHGDAPGAGDTSGPQVVFEATTPTVGRYLLYLDFQVDGQVHSVPLVLDTVQDADTTDPDTAPQGTAENEEEGAHEHGE